jgi:excisionase family DNA binding protein
LPLLSQEDQEDRTPRPAVYTINETATVLRCSKPTVYRLIKRDGLPVVRLGADLRVPEADLLEWLKARTVAQ